MKKNLSTIALTCMLCTFFSSSLVSMETSPRLLICVDPKASFSIEELAQKANAAFLKVEQRNPFRALLPACLDKPIVVINYEDSTPLIKKIKRLAHRCGYRYLYLVNETLNDAVEKTLAALASSPSKSSQIYHLSTEDAKKLYSLQQSIERVMVRAGINYWAGRGALLGAVRHKGIMPWEDYLTLHIRDMDEEKLKTMDGLLNAEGLSLLYNKERDFYKIFQKEGDIIQDPANPDEILPFRYPVADLFVMSLECRNEAEDLYVHRSWFHYWHWNTENFTFEQIDTIARVPYGPGVMPIPGKPELTLNQIYGLPQAPELWRKYALEPFWDHRIESDHAWPGNSLVVIDDFSPSHW